jgi:hypothetical protein
VHRTGMKTLGEECDESQPEECQIGSDCSSAAGEPKCLGLCGENGGCANGQCQCSDFFDTCEDICVCVPW